MNDGPQPPSQRRSSVVAVALLAAVRIYRAVVSPWLGNHCRFAPSCSQYAMTAVERHGALHGSWMALRRLLRCHPWNAGGWDPVSDN